MPGRRQSDPASERAAEVFSKELRRTSGNIIGHLTQKDRVGLRDVYQGHVLAAFDLLEMAIRARRMYAGKMPPAPGAPPQVWAAEREEIFREIMQLIGDDLLTSDTTHDYAVGLLKRRRRGPQAGFPL